MLYLSLSSDPHLSQRSHCISTYCYRITELTFNFVCFCGAFVYCLQYSEILSGTKVIKPAALGKPAPKTESCLVTPKKAEDSTETDYCVQFQNVGI